MLEEIKHDKEVLIAKMNHRTTLLTTIIGGLVTLVAATVPIVLVNKKPQPTSATQSTTTTSTPETSTVPTITLTPTAESHGKKVKD